MSDNDDDPDYFSSKHHLLFILKVTFNHTTFTFDFSSLIWLVKTFFSKRRAVKHPLWHEALSEWAWWCMDGCDQPVCASQTTLSLLLTEFEKSSRTCCIKNKNTFWVYVFLRMMHNPVTWILTWKTHMNEMHKAAWTLSCLEKLVGLAIVVQIIPILNKMLLWFMRGR